MTTAEAGIGSTGSIGSGAHTVEVSGPAMDAGLHQVHARCSCGWQTVGIALTLGEAASRARTHAVGHTAAALWDQTRTVAQPARRWTLRLARRPVR